MKKVSLLIAIVIAFAVTVFVATPKNAHAASGSLQYSLKSDYWLYDVYYVGAGYCPSASRNEGTVWAWNGGYPTCN